MNIFKAFKNLFGCFRQVSAVETDRFLLSLLAKTSQKSSQNPLKINLNSFLADFMKIRYIFILLGTLSILCGCASDDDKEMERKQVAVSFTISTRAAEDSASPAELINSWWIAVVGNDGKVYRILERSADKTDAVESEESYSKLAEGDYTLYAFANIARSDIGVPVVQGERMPDLSNVTWSKEIGPVGSPVPMTGKKNVKITQNSGFEIEVVRLWAKLRFRFTSNASQPVTIHRISMMPALTRAVYLMPVAQRPVLPAGTACELLEHPVDMTVNNDGSSVDEIFYLFESTAASHPTGRYPLSFDLTIGDSERTVSALAYQLAFINRNDFITIPVLITDWDLQLDVRFYPPIGGYPAVIVDNKGDEFYARFGTSGYFEITTQVSDRYTGAAVAAGNVSVQLSVESGAVLFSRIPVLQNGEIVGELAENRTGTAVINLDVTIKNGSIQQTITRKLYIIRS